MSRSAEARVSRTHGIGAAPNTRRCPSRYNMAPPPRLLKLGHVRARLPATPSDDYAPLRRRSAPPRDLPRHGRGRRPYTRGCAFVGRARLPGVPAVRHPGPRIRADPVRLLRPRAAARLQLQGARCLPLLQHPPDGQGRCPPRRPGAALAPARQWVLSVPKRLRPYLHGNPKVAGRVLGIFLRAMRSTLHATSPEAPESAAAVQLSAVSFLHRFGSSGVPPFSWTGQRL